MPNPTPRNRRRFSDDLKRKLCQDQDYRCMYCGRKRAFTDLEIDHKTPVQRGGSDNLRNLQMLCPTCNKRKANQTDSEFRKRYREVLPNKKELPQRTIRQDVFDMVTATTDRPRSAKANQSTRSAAKAPAAVTQLTFRREVGFFADILKFTWEPPESNEPICGYRLQYKVVRGGPDSGWKEFAAPHEGTQQHFEAHKVPQPLKFAFRVRARNNSGWGPWSKPFSELEAPQKAAHNESSQAQDKPPATAEPVVDGPDPISQVSFERINGLLSDAVVSRWEVPESPVGLVTGYEIQFRMHQGQNTGTWSNANPPHDGRNPSYRFNQVPKPRVNQFSIRLRAKNDHGPGSWSQEFPDTSS